MQSDIQRKSRGRSTVTYLALAALLACASCAAPGSAVQPGSRGPIILDSRSAIDPAGSSETAAQPGLPGKVLPAPAAIAGELAALRKSSFNYPDAWRRGSDFSALQHSSLVSASADEAVFAPAGGGQAGLSGAAYALYPFNLPQAAGAATALSLSWGAAPDPAQLYIGLSNWDSNRWSWFHDPGGAPLSIADLGPYTNAQDDQAVAVLLLGSSQAPLQRLEFFVTELPLASLTAEPATLIAGASVSFDASASSDPDGTISNYEWDFDGDGLWGEPGDEQSAAGSPLANVGYSTVGEFNAAVRVSDDRLASASASALITVLAVPEVVLSASPQLGVKPLEVNFNADTSTITEGIAAYEWDLDGDGTFGEAGPEQLAADQNFAQYTYTVTGDVTATVKAVSQSSIVYTDSVTINVGNSAPSAVLLASQSSGFKPLLVSFDGSSSTDPGGSIVNYEWDFDNDTIYGETGAEADANGLAGVDVLFSDPGSYRIRLRVTDDDGATASDSKLISVTNSPPLAALSADVSSGDAPLLVQLDASGSTDPGGSIANYRWDFDSDGLFSNSTEEQTAEGQAVPDPYTYTAAGIYNASVEVTDDNGAVDTASLALTAHGWSVLTLDDQPSAASASGASLAVVGSVPVAAYYAAGVGIRFARSASASGSLPSDWSVASAPAASGTQLSVAAVFNAPAMAYVSLGGQLVYRRASGSGLLPGDWSAEMPVETNAAEPTLAQVNGAPALYFRSNTRGTVSYVRANSQTGTVNNDWGGVIDVIVPNGIGSDARDPWALTVVNGRPAAVYTYYNGPADEEALTYSRSSNSLGDGIDDVDGWDINEDAAPAGAGDADWSIMGLQIVSGLPAIIVRDTVNEGKVYFQAADNADGTGWTGTPVHLFDLSAMDTQGSFAVVGGHPSFAYQGPLSADVRFVMSSTANGGQSADWAGIETVAGGSPADIQLVDVGGLPALVYIDTVEDALIYAVRI
ncbi:PKD domain-containing protein [bacterium]|nr:PKD domain-containing protein [bacterium]